MGKYREGGGQEGDGHQLEELDLGCIVTSSGDCTRDLVPASPGLGVHSLELSIDVCMGEIGGRGN